MGSKNHSKRGVMLVPGLEMEVISRRSDGY